VTLLSNSHEVGIFHELGDDFTCAYPLSLICYRRDRHEALFRGSMHPVGDLIEGLCKIPYRDVCAVCCASCCAHVGRSCRHWFHQRVHWQTVHLRICLRSSGRAGYLKVLAFLQ
jgi:hypothetical protein